MKACQRKNNLNKTTTSQEKPSKVRRLSNLHVSEFVVENFFAKVED